MSSKVKILNIYHVNGVTPVEDMTPTIKIGDGYMKVGDQNAVTFYADVIESPDRRAYPAGSTRTFGNIPVLFIESGVEDGSDVDSNMCEICFPEYAGWSVFCASGGKTLSIALRRDGV